MTRRRFAPPNKWADLALGTFGAWGTVAGVASVATGTWTWQAVAGLAGGPWMIYTALAGWRCRRAHRGLLEASAVFRSLVRALQPVPTFYRHDDTDTVFARIPGQLGADYLYRIPEAEIDQVDRDLDDGGYAVFVADEFTVGPFSAAVLRSPQGARLRQGPDGLEVIDDAGGNESRWRRLRGGWLSLTSGLLDASEGELREVHAQIVDGHRIDPAEDD